MTEKGCLPLFDREVDIIFKFYLTDFVASLGWCNKIC